MIQVRIAAGILAIALCGVPAAADKRKAAPVEIHTLDVAMRGSTAILGRTGGIVTIDTTDPRSPVELGRISLGTTAQALTLDGERVWVAAGHHGFVRVDVSEPEQPVLDGRVNVDGAVRHVLPLDEHRVFLAEDRRGLSLYDVRNFERPRRRLSLATRDRVRHLARQDDLLAVAEGKAGVRLFDISNPESPRQLSRVLTETAAAQVTLDGETLWVVAGKGGLLRYDIESPHSPRLIDSLPSPRSAQSMLMRGERILIACGDAGIQMARIANGALTDDGRLRLPQSFPALRLAASGDMLAVATQVGGLALVEFDESDEPSVRFPRERRMKVSFSP